ncbi:three-helix bundle dimerization domain-containing protein [Nocardia mikamii]|uniref:three-helix bundle dimerization domain-containing protein n=1 Tax=Nocardia mikamii TaxID=508464 RepID=UPI000AE87463|nr:hypothetical protein [Nocardia mikamii]
MGDATDREEKALRQLTDRLVGHYGSSHSPELVQELVGQVRRRFDGHAVRDFVPILVERIVRRELQHTPPQPKAEDYSHELEYAAAPVVPERVSAPSIEEDISDASASEPGPPADRAASADSRDAGADQSVTDRTESATPQRHSLPDAAAEVPVETTADEREDLETPAVSAISDVAIASAHSPVEPSKPTTVAQTSPASDAPPEPDRETAPSPATDPTATPGLVTTLRQPRILAVAAAVVVVVVALVVAFGFRGGDNATPALAPALTTAHGVVGSEKMGLFTDPRVVDALARKGIRLEVDPAGSRQIATSVKLDGDDFAFPSSSLAAERIQRERGITAKYTPFSSPMVVASFRPIVDLLARAGIVRQGPVPTFDMRRYLDLTQQGTQWDQLEGNTAYPVRKNVLISTTDPRSSNSAAMYLAVAAYVANDDAIVQGPAAENFVLSKVSRLFTRQGYTENSSAGPFGEYLAAGMGPTPMVWGYESQFVEAAVAGKLPPDAVMLYPSPTVLSRHTLVPLTATGDRVGQLLSTDPELQRLAAEHGFRTADPAQFTAVTAEHHIPVAPGVVDVVDPPTYDTLEHLLDGVARSYN